MNYISFPGLFDRDFFIDPTAFSIGPFTVQWYGLLIAVGMITAYLLLMWRCKQIGEKQNEVTDIVIWGIVSALIGAKLYYVAFNFQQYRGNFGAIFSGSGLAIYGGVIGALVGGYVHAKIYKKDFMRLLDLCIVYIPIGQMIGRWGNFTNQEAFGQEVAWQGMPWRMTGNIIQRQIDPNTGLGYTYVHPTFLYESLWCLAVFLLLIWFRDKAKYKGEVASMYFILYGFGRFFIEGLRTDSLMFFSFRVSQLLSFILVIGLSALFVWRRTHGGKLRVTDETV